MIGTLFKGAALVLVGALVALTLTGLGVGNMISEW